MQINFSSPVSFLAEVEARKEQDDLAENLVRLQLEPEEKNRALKEFWLRAAFLDQMGNLYQFIENCGREPPDRDQPSGAAEAHKLEAFLRNKLMALGITIREGCFVG